MTNHHVEVIHNAHDQRFEATLEDNDIALMDYQISGNTITFIHTEVPPKYEGRGIASQIAKVALDYARDKGYKIQSTCSFVDMYLRKHKEYQSTAQGY